MTSGPPRALQFIMHLVWCYYNAVSLIKNLNNRSTIACQGGRDMGWFFYEYKLVMPKSPQCCMEYQIILDHDSAWLYVISLNSLAPGRFKFRFRLVIFKPILVNGGSGISYEIALRWMPQDKSTLVQVMAWCRQATSHYLNQCWLRSMSPNGVIRPQWVNTLHSRFLWGFIISPVLTLIYDIHCPRCIW